MATRPTFFDPWGEDRKRRGETPPPAPEPVAETEPTPEPQPTGEQNENA